ncbi:MAG: RagB/SusD family nutrient uptake outer membrane protein, partial [Tannerellaceae bacterium]|nr:RagB/SusD family nutrient uptake outer membrane protein [Tannerellaceae bacterium]
MKKIYSFLIGTFTFFSCTNLESEMYNIISPDIFPTTEAEAEALVVAAAYGPFRSNYWDGIFSTASGGIQIITEMTTDIGDCQWNDAVWPDVITMNFTSHSEGVIQFYEEYLRDISKMTLAMERIKDIPMTEERLKEMNAQLHCGRGWLAYLLYDLYGPVQIATIEELNNPTADIQVARPDKEWMVNYIETELKEAIKVLPVNYSPSDVNYGRFTGGLAYMILMKLYMLEGEWGKAEECGRELIKSEYGYGLMDEYEDIFTLENEKNKEIIWACQCSRNVNKQLWLAHVLSSEYPTKNPNIQKWGGYRVPWSFYETFDPTDKRLKVLVGEFEGTDGKIYNQQNPGTVLIKGALPVKYGEDPVATGEESQVDWIIYRYADVLTQLAEVIVRKNNSVTSEAVDLLNRIRKRAGIEEYKESDFTGVDDFLEKLLLERGHEFWFEGLRRADLIRHGKYIEYAKTYKNSKTAQDHMVLMPLPQSVIDEGQGVV